MPSAISRWLTRTNRFSFSIYAGAIAFITYFSMYAYRKPYTAATFSDTIGLFGHDFALKSALVIAQTIGYAGSKFLGIKVLTELPPGRRALGLVGLIGFAEAALLMFGILPGSWKMLAIFLNGLPLGMVWGLVFSFLEGRRTSDALGAMLSASYILASGAVKSVGAVIMQRGVSETWMPFVTGLLFLPVIMVSAWLLAQIPRPSAEEEVLRTRRQTMNAAERGSFFRAFAPGLIAITFMAMVLTGFRTIRDDFAREIFDALGYAHRAGIFGLSETLVTIFVLAALGLMVIIKDDRKAFLIQQSMMVGGVALMGLATFAFGVGVVNGLTWMVLVGIGLNVAYVPAGCFLFDRLIGATRFVGTAVFMIYVTDAFGYASSVGILLYREFFQPQLQWLTFLRYFAYVASVTGVLAFGFALAYFARRTHPSRIGDPAT